MMHLYIKEIERIITPYRSSTISVTVVVPNFSSSDLRRYGSSAQI